MTAPELSLLIVNYNSWRLCVDAVRSFRAHAPTRPDGSPLPYEVVVVDNASPQRDEEAERELDALCAETGGRLIRHPENGGYSKGMNLAFAHARGRYLLVSNPDIQYLPNTVDPLVRALERDGSIGAAAPRGYWDPALQGILPPNILPTMGDLCRLTRAALSPGAVQSYARRRTREALPIWMAEVDIDLPMLSGCCFLMERSFVERIGFFDERFPLYYEDTDLSVRIVRAGRRIVQVGGSDVVHLFDRSGQTDPGLKMERYWKSRRLYYRKWYGRLGALAYDVCRRIQDSRLGRARSAILPHRTYTDLGAGHGKPVLRFDRSYPSLLVEFCLDPKFFLAGAVLTSGDSWTPCDAMYRGFGPTTYWFRVVDATDPRQRVLGVYRYQQLHPAVAMPQSEEADREGQARLKRFQETGRWA